MLGAWELLVVDMSHWAELDENNVVIRVLVGDNNDPNGDEGYKWLIDNLGGRWMQTSYNGNIRKRFAGIGFTYNEEFDVFLFPKPFESWVLDSDFEWVAPTAIPNDGKMYVWNEEDLEWKSSENAEIGKPLWTQ